MKKLMYLAVCIAAVCFMAACTGGGDTFARSDTPVVRIEVGGAVSSVEAVGGEGGGSGKANASTPVVKAEVGGGVVRSGVSAK